MSPSGPLRDPDLRILVGRWGPPALADESTQALRDAGVERDELGVLEQRVDSLSG